MLNLELLLCVELDVSKPLVDKVWVSFEDDDYPDNNEGFWQQVQYDEIPHYCSKCFHIGHSVENCKRDFEKERMQAEKYVGVDLHGSEVLQCGEIVDQCGDTKVEIEAIDLEEINVTYHVESAPTSPTDPRRFDNNNYPEDVAPVTNQALDDVLAKQLIDKSLDHIPYDV
ncbi:hypothetical protein LIER_28911 [Lithospermum erythrorhizon]|uniref:Uncharacterized protein n=1 Tax=Lithospermum erythrorhizon TaxID=34254 RepID=A0AAV3RIE7_LITER